MENASKALIMAASVLIAIMIFGALMLMFNNLTSYQKTEVKTEQEAKVLEFNNQFETYNRTNVRGSELYSLLNRAIDYNIRKSVVSNDEGKYIAYEPIKVTFDFNGKVSMLYAPTASVSDSYTHLIKQGKYEQSATTNTFANEVKSKIDTLESTYGAESLTNLTKAVTKIFIANSSSDSEKNEAIENFNKISKKEQITNWNKISENSTIRKAVFQYYEYVQFKRARFNCEGNSYSTNSIKYNDKTGRITELHFKFTGNFE